MSDIERSVEVYDQDENYLPVVSATEKPGGGIVVTVEVEAAPSTDLHAGAVSLLDDLSDVLAEVQRGELPVDDARVNDVLRRSVLHVNGGQSDLEFRQIAASDHTT
jgi:hypothetical protein